MLSNVNKYCKIRRLLGRNERRRRFIWYCVFQYSKVQTKTFCSKMKYNNLNYIFIRFTTMCIYSWIKKNLLSRHCLIPFRFRFIHFLMVKGYTSFGIQRLIPKLDKKVLISFLELRLIFIVIVNNKKKK